MSDNKLKELAEYLTANPTANVDTAGERFGIVVTDETFKELKGIHGTFQCELCSRWKDESEESLCHDICTECLEQS